MQISDGALDELLKLITSAEADATIGFATRLLSDLTSHSSDGRTVDTSNAEFRASHAVWVQRLKAHTEGTWNDDQYELTGHVINLADYKRAALAGFVSELSNRGGEEFSHARANHDGLTESLFFHDGQGSDARESEVSFAASPAATPEFVARAVPAEGASPSGEASLDWRRLRNTLMTLLAVSALHSIPANEAVAATSEDKPKPPATYHSSEHGPDDPGPEASSGLISTDHHYGRDQPAAHAASNILNVHASFETFHAADEALNQTHRLGSSTPHLDNARAEPAGFGGNSNSGNVIEGTNDGETIVGSAHDDVIHGGGGNDVIFGGDGNDVIFGGDGNDKLYGDAGNDLLDGGRGSDLLDGGDGRDTASYAHSDTGVDVDLALKGPQISGGEANGDILISVENVTGSAHDDHLSGDDGANVIDGGAGADVMKGGRGDDVYIVDNVHDQVFEDESSGTDLIVTTLNFYALPDNVETLGYAGNTSFEGVGNQLNNIIVGGSLSDLLAGLDGNDILMGGAGDDVLDGGTGYNILDGGKGNDTLIVFSGSDTIVLRPGFGNDVVDGFETQGHDGADWIDVSAYGSADASMSSDIILVTQGDDTVLTVGSDSLTLHHSSAANVDKSDFLIA